MVTPPFCRDRSCNSHVVSVRAGGGQFVVEVLAVVISRQFRSSQRPTFLQPSFCSEGHWWHTYAYMDRHDRGCSPLLSFYSESSLSNQASAHFPQPFCGPNLHLADIMVPPPGCPVHCLIAGCAHNVPPPCWDKKRHCYRTMAADGCKMMQGVFEMTFKPAQAFFTNRCVTLREFCGTQSFVYVFGTDTDRVCSMLALSKLRSVIMWDLTDANLIIMSSGMRAL